MVNSWALALPALILAAFAAAYLLAKRSAKKPVYVAHTAGARSSSRYRALLTRLRLAVAGLGLGLAIAVAGASVLLARPYSLTERNEKLASRDIVLCLDVSGSVIGYVSEVMDTFEELVDKFDGERVSLVVWNATSRVVFPLTDDYEMVKEQLQLGADSLEATEGSWGPEPVDYDAYDRFTAGTWTDVGGGSLVGDGVVTCTQQFDLEDTERSRTLIFATDNDPSPPGAQIYQLGEALDYAHERDIQVHGMFIDIGEWAIDGLDDAMEEEVNRIDGHFFRAGDEDAAGRLIEDIEAQQASDLDAKTELIVSDDPGPWPAITAAGVTLLAVIGWRVRI